MKIGLFGGCFDPIHYGHIRPVIEARRALGLDRVYFLPTARPPHKPGRRFAPPQARYAMVELALLDEPELWVSSVEMTPGRTAYTIDSVESFRRELPDAELHLLLGADSFAELTTWRRWPDLPRLARLVVLLRPGWRLEDARSRLAPELLALADSDRVVFLANPPQAVSATALRELLARGAAPPPGVLPPLVLEYIRKYSLYR